MKIFSKAALPVAFSFLVSPFVLANEAHHAPSGQAAQAVAAEISEGEIRKINKDTGKLTIKHGELKNLGMPAMTMAFRAKDPAMLDQVKPGDKIQFVVDKVNGQLTVTQLEVQE